MTEEEGPEVVAVLLAAGLGTRFRGPAHKLMAGFRGAPLVSHALAAMRASGIARRAVVAGAVELDGVLEDEVLLVNPEPARGLASSLAIARDWALSNRAEAMVIGLGDQPLIPASAWSRLASARGAPIMVATYQGKRRNPVRIAREAFDLLPESGDEGARVLFSSFPALVQEVECEGEPVDIDTVEELDEWNW
ncbi:MAG: nucleotidyltransferase family protein [Nitrospiraceae bacterium]|nr:nucleotidyltransferase family protein [Nitrospiraceae bacterium]MDA8208215.1 nucleotidyltransferase family protein [Actinomycetota bacterium]